MHKSPKASTHILLITDTDRLKRVFESLGKHGVLQLRTAATLVQADLEISESPPEFTFVQSRISGFSGDILLRHLKKILPKDAKIIFLTGDADELAQADKHAVPFLDLTLDDDALASIVTDTLNGTSRPSFQDLAPVHVSPARNIRHPKIADAAIAPGAAPEELTAEQPKGPKAVKPKEPKAVKPKEPKTVKPKEPKTVKPKEPKTAKPKEPKTAKPKEPKTAKPKEPETEQLKEPKAEQLKESEAEQPKEPEAEQPKEPEAVKPKEPETVKLKEPEAEQLKEPRAEQLKEPEAEQSKEPEAEHSKEPVLWEPHVDLPQQDLGKAGSEPFAEIMRRASTKDVSSAPVPFEVDERFSLGRPLSEFMEQPGMQDRSSKEEISGPIPVGDYTREPLADATHSAQKKKRHLWVFALALALALIPLFSYIAGKKTATTERSFAPGTGSGLVQRPNHVPVPPQATVPAPAATPVPAPVPGSVTPPAAKSVVKPSVKSGPEPAAIPTVKQGLKSLPPVVAQAKLDAAYGKTHPGWQRYLGARFEYKLFKEAGLFRALQVIAPKGETIPDQLLKRVLQEFGGIDNYQVVSAGAKGNYLVEQGVTKGSVALTIYRKKDDLQMKAFVVYYR